MKTLTLLLLLILLEIIIIKATVLDQESLKELRRSFYPKVTSTFQYKVSTTHTLSNLHSINCSVAQCDIIGEVDGDSTQTVPLRLVFWDTNVVRYWLAIDGTFQTLVQLMMLLLENPQLH